MESCLIFLGMCSDAPYDPHLNFQFRRMKKS
jgi:hypothetical protein